MSKRNVLARLPSCSEPQINGLITAYCFGRVSEEEKKALEVHVLECDYCWTQVQRLEQAVHVLSSERTLINSLSASDVATVFGISARLERFLGGHIWHALIACFLYAGLFGVTLLLEVSYRFDAYGRTALKLSPVVLLWIFTTSVIALSLDWLRTSKGKRYGLGTSVATFLAAAGLLFAALSFFLPQFPVTELSTPSSSAQTAYLKDIIYSLLLMLIFLAPTFHFVVAMQRELHLGRHRLALEVLTCSKFSVVPTGAFYVRIWMLVVSLMSMATYSAFSTANLLDHLSPSPYTGLFTGLIWLRLILHYGLALKCLSWYHRALDNLKRECLVAGKTKQS